MSGCSFWIEFERLFAVDRLADNLELFFASEYRDQPLPEHGVIVRYQNSDGGAYFGRGTLSEQRVKVHIPQSSGDGIGDPDMPGFHGIEKLTNLPPDGSFFRCTHRQWAGNPERERIRWKGLQSHKPAAGSISPFPFAIATRAAAMRCAH